MIGLILLQINITGDIQKDQQLLLYGIGGLISLIVLAMITIVIVVLVRKSRRNKSAAALQASTAPPQTKQEIEEKTFGPSTPVKTEEAKPVEIKVEEPKAVEPTPVIEEKKPEPVIVPVIEKTEPISPPLEEKKFDLKAHKQKLDSENPADKMQEIRDRLEEIRKQKNTDPDLVLPKITAKPRIEVPIVEEPKQIEPDPIYDEHEPAFSEEMDETLIVEDSESVAIPITDMADEISAQSETVHVGNEPQTTTVVDEGVMKEVSVLDTKEISIVEEPIVETKKDDTAPLISHLPNGKYLPMKKLTFAEWVELFK